MSDVPLFDALHVLQRAGGGHFINDLADALWQVADEVVRVGKPGGVAFTFKIDQPNAGEPLVTIEHSVQRKPPAGPSRSQFYFAVEGLHDADPRQSQMELEFRSVEAGPTEVRTVIDQPHTTKEVSA